MNDRRAIISVALPLREQLRLLFIKQQLVFAHLNPKELHYSALEIGAKPFGRQLAAHPFLRCAKLHVVVQLTSKLLGISHAAALHCCSLVPPICHVALLPLTTMLARPATSSAQMCFAFSSTLSSGLSWMAVAMALMTRM